MDSRAREDDNGPMSFGEPAPEPNDGPSMHDLVIEDMKARKAFGLAKYGTPLQAHNGRKPLKDLYEELLDAVVYARQALEENPVQGHTVEPMPEHFTVDSVADDLMRTLDSIAEELPGIHEAMANRIGMQHFQRHGGQIGTMSLHPVLHVDFYATCLDCTPGTPLPFSTELSRDRWAVDHANDNPGHRVIPAEAEK